MKKRLDIRIESDLRDGLDARVSQSGLQLTAIVERYIADGLARDSGRLVEIQSLPEIRTAVREESSKVMAQLYQQLSHDLAAHNKRADDRLAGLVMKAVRFAGLGQRMLYMFIVKQAGQRDADRIYETAKEQTGKDLARSSKEGESTP